MTTDPDTLLLASSLTPNIVTPPPETSGSPQNSSWSSGTHRTRILTDGGREEDPDDNDCSSVTGGIDHGITRIVSATARCTLDAIGTSLS